MSRVLCIGETMVQVTPSRGGRISAHTDFRLVAGGAESNVASALTQLGAATAWLGALGRDPFGEIVMKSLESDGVDTSFVVQDETRKTAVYFKDVRGSSTDVYYYREGSAMSHAGPNLLEAVTSLSWDLVHMSGITPALSDSCRNLTEKVIVNRAFGDTPTSFDINYRSALWKDSDARSALADFANHADIVFVGMDEAHEIWGFSDPAEVRSFLSGPQFLIVKNSEKAATEYSHEGTFEEPAIDVDVVEKVGAGDAFAAGWLSSFLAGKNGSQRLRLGHLMAAEALKTHTDAATPPSPEVIATYLEPRDSSRVGLSAQE